MPRSFGWATPSGLDYSTMHLNSEILVGPPTPERRWDIVGPPAPVLRWGLAADTEVNPQARGRGNSRESYDLRLAELAVTNLAHYLVNDWSNDEEETRVTLIVRSLTKEQKMLLRELVDNVANLRYQNRVPAGHPIEVKVPDHPNLRWLKDITAQMPVLNGVELVFVPVELEP